MPARDHLATVTQLPVPDPVYLTKIPNTANMSLDIDRTKLRRHILAARLHHGSDGVHGSCYCGRRPSPRGIPRDMWNHIKQEIAAATHLPFEYVAAIMDIHHSAAQMATGDMRCHCGETYSDEDSYGNERHQAEAIAANAPAADVTRCLAAIRAAGRKPTGD
jgi:hypothetical protein